jgi:hypothetical protein
MKGCVQKGTPNGIFLPRQVREVIAGASNQSGTGTVSPHENAEAVMLDFVNPAGSARWGLGGGG